MKPADPRIRELETLNAVLDAFNRETDFARGLQTALEDLVALVDVSTGWVFTSTNRAGDAHASGFALSAATGLPPALADADAAALHNGRCECQGLFARGDLDRGVNMVTCSRLASARGNRGGLEIHASVPLLAPSGPVGILNLAAPGSRRFDRETLVFLAAIGKAIGTAFERHRLQEDKVEEARFGAVLEERQRLARDMHDALSQLLFAAELSIGAARERAGDAGPDPSLSHAAEILGDAQAELRALVEVLRVPDITCGLETALQRLALRTSGSTNVHLDAHGAEHLDGYPDITEALYRIAQEALHNALRHAGADHVRIRLRATADKATLEVDDDGIGIGDRSTGGMGIAGMRDRAEDLGGSFSASPKSAGGTQVTVDVPLAPGPVGREDRPGQTS